MNLLHIGKKEITLQQISILNRKNTELLELQFCVCMFFLFQNKIQNQIPKQYTIQLSDFSQDFIKGKKTEEDLKAKLSQHFDYNYKRLVLANNLTKLVLVVDSSTNDERFFKPAMIKSPPDPFERRHQGTSQKNEVYINDSRFDSIPQEWNKRIEDPNSKNYDFLKFQRERRGLSLFLFLFFVQCVFANKTYTFCLLLLVFLFFLFFFF